MLTKFLDRLDAYFARQSANVNLGFAFAFALLIGIGDYFTPGQLYVLYLFPVAFASWHGGIRYGQVVAIYSAAAVFVAEAFLDQTFQSQLPSIVTLVVRLLTYLVFAVVVGRLKESQRLQRQLTEFIVHDIRSPVTSSISGLETLKSVSDNLDELQQELVEIALVGNQRTLSLVTSMLDVSKLQSGKMETQFTSVDVAQLVEEAVDDVRLWAQTNEITLDQRVSVASWVLDPNLVRRTLVNLLSNALKFSPPGSTVVVSAESSGNVIRFSVADQGPGIPPEYKERIFEPFNQVKGTKGGSGLGLTFCRLAVQAHHGRIWVESTLGHGTTMVFTMPMGHVDAAAAGK